MKMSSLFTALATFAFAAAVQAAPAIITVKGSIYQQPNIDGKCGASIYSAYVIGSYISESGKKMAVFDCLESIAVPLQGTQDPGASLDVFADAKSTLAKVLGQKLKMTFAVESSEKAVLSMGTLLSVEVIAEKK